MTLLQEHSTKTAQLLCVGMGWFPSVPGGLNRYVYELTHQWAKTGNSVELCAAGLPPQEPHQPLVLTNLSSPETHLLQRCWQSRQRFNRRQFTYPDAVNLHFALYSFPLLSDLPDAPITCTFHGPWALESAREGQRRLGTKLKHWVEQQVYRRCDRFIVLSQAFRTILSQDYGIAPESIHVIPGGVNLEWFQANLSRYEARQKLGWPTDRQILFTPRRLVKRMGLTNLIQAMATVRQKSPEVWLAIAGKGPLRETLEHQVQSLDLQGNVKFLGYLPDDDLPIAYQAADLTVVPSESLEGFGLILTESLASGTPALCTPVGGMPEVVSPLDPQLVTADSDAAALQERLIDYLASPSKLPTRAACRQYAQDYFSWQTVASRVKEVMLA